jgi:hypothetical protein
MAVIERANVVHPGVALAPAKGGPSMNTYSRRPWCHFGSLVLATCSVARAGTDTFNQGEAFIQPCYTVLSYSIRNFSA